MPKVSILSDVAKPTMRLVSLEHCVRVEPQFGIKPLETSESQLTPHHHAFFELTDLKEPGQREPHGMPWEELSDADFLEFRKKLPEAVTGDAIFETLVKPELAKPLDGEQRSVEWHNARAYAVTASQFALTSDDANTLLKTKTYPKAHAFRGNLYTEWGSAHEAHAEEAFVQFLSEQNFKGEIQHVPHIRSKCNVFLGFSPDGLLWNEDKSEVALIEYKCPAGRRSGQGHPYSADKYCVPPRYMPQIQGSLAILRELHPTVRCERAFFVVWQPHQFFVTHVPYAQSYAERTLERAASFYKQRFLPSCADAVLTRELRARQGLTSGVLNATS